MVAKIAPGDFAVARRVESVARASRDHNDSPAGSSACRLDDKLTSVTDHLQKAAAIAVLVEHAVSLGNHDSASFTNPFCLQFIVALGKVASSYGAAVKHRADIDHSLRLIQRLTARLPGVDP